MRVILDTQILIWFQLDDPQLPGRIRTVIENPANEVCVSYLSFIEITIKQVVNRLPTFPVSTEELIHTTKADGFTLLPVSLSHVNAYKRVSFHADHRDPFDRLILATTLAEHIPLVSADGKFDRYRDIIDVIG